MQAVLVQVETRANIRLLRLNQPERRNALSLDLRAELIAAVEAALADDDIRALVLTGNGGVFCAGGDLSSMRGATSSGGRERLRRLHKLAKLLVDGGKPVVAAVEGYAYGAGLSLALLCDQVVASETAKFCASFTRVGLMADLAALWSVPQRVNAGWARRLLMLAEEVDAATAGQIGLVDAVVPGGAALDHALGLAGRLAEGPPVALALTKQALARGPQPLDALLAMEADMQGVLFGTEDLAEGRDAFLAKRKPVFKGR
ncbi:enoyl-CoA hydratase-related protein [Ferrovibrio sp.]|uniref:enoyl-CoA hydratase/isomerase family protein n=1 Tax=Ferrovibrio sp. TaxID=1917215 RepID=UPI0025BF6C51|nr:enoyl-CoA hydratase-related protein [Ferrovibrio sp.]MBX3453055.1 enoyl-CoA hydratase/isomerase family protein [Ferrovibrio sp.]